MLGAQCDHCRAHFWGLNCQNVCLGGMCTPCSDHGVCDEGVNGTGQCRCFQSASKGFWNGSVCDNCASGYYGPTCSHKCSCVNAGCFDGIHGNGTCLCSFEAARYKASDCTCADGRGGPQCELCPGGTPCNRVEGLFGKGHVCDKSTGLCQCDKYGPWEGAACDVARALGCTGCDANRSVCNYETRLCECLTGYVGTGCARDCPMLNDQVCNGHGTCYAATIGAVERAYCECFSDSGHGYWKNSSLASPCSACQDGYSGSNCTTPCPVHKGMICNNRGLCLDGACKCNSGYCGAKCDESVFEGADCVGCVQRVIVNGVSYPAYGPLCDKPCLCDLSHSTCSDGRAGTGKCTCSGGYAGERCDVPCPGPVGINTFCSGRGVCNASGLCECTSGFATFNCGVKCPVCAYGRCKDGASGDGTCECPFSYAGARCELPCQCQLQGGRCARGCDLLGRSICDAGWDGEACQLCASGFAGETCNISCIYGKTVGHICNCSTNYGGPSCSKVCAVSPEGVTCSAPQGHCDEGSSHTGECLCDSPWEGPSCNCSDSLCRTVYSPNAHCDATTGMCVCLESWSGSDCQGCSATHWGYRCEEYCPCAHGLCDRILGNCLCYADAVRGFWAGSLCSSCAAGYFGERCTQATLLSSPMTSLVVSAQRFHTSRFLLRDTPSDMLLIVGSQCVAYWGASKPVPDKRSVDLLFSLTKCYSPVFAWLSNGTLNILVNCMFDSTVTRRVEWYQGSLSDPFNMHIRNKINKPVQERVVYAINIRRRGSDALCLLMRDEYATWAENPFYLHCLGENGFENRLFFSGQSYTPTDVVHIHYSSLSDTMMLFGMVYSECRIWNVSLGKTTVPFTVQNVPVSFEDSSLGNVTSHCAAIEAVTAQTQASSTLFHMAIARRTASDKAVTRSFFLRLELPRGLVTFLDATQTSDNDTTVSMRFDALSSIVYCAVNSQLRMTTSVMKIFSQGSQYEILGSQSLASNSEGATADQRLVALELDEEYRIAFLLRGFYAGTVVRRLALYLVQSVFPTFADRRGGTWLTVTGRGFTGRLNQSKCLVGGSESPARVQNSTTIMCQATDAADICVTPSVEVSCLEGVFTVNRVHIMRFHSPLVRSATPVIQPYRYPQAVTVHGTGFIRGGVARCQIRDAAAVDIPTIVTTAGEVLSSDAVRCDAIPSSQLNHSWVASVDVAVDGTVFTGTPAPINYTGEWQSVVLFPSYTQVQSNDIAAIPPVELVFVDDVGNRVGPLFSEYASAFVEAGTNATDFVQIKLQGADPVVVRDGSAVFNSLSLVLPNVGNAQLLFTVVRVLDSTIVASVNMTVKITPGILARISIVQQPSSTVDTTGKLSTAPVVRLEDKAGNPVDSTYDSAVVVAEVVEQAIAGIVIPDYLYRASIPSNNTQSTVRNAITVSFQGLLVSARGGFRYTIRLHVKDSPHVPPLSTNLIEGICQSGQVHLVGSYGCLACMGHASCNGTDIVTLKQGYWRATPYSYSVYECAPMAACPGGNSTSQCNVGYEGPVCGRCQAGYGRGVGFACSQCFAVALAAFLFVIIIIVMIIALALVVVMVAQNWSRESATVVVFRIFISQMQTTVAIGTLSFEYPAFFQYIVAWISSIFDVRVLELNISDCLMRSDGTNVFVKFVVFLAVPVIALSIASFAWLLLFLWPRLMYFGDALDHRGKKRPRKSHSRGESTPPRKDLTVTDPKLDSEKSQGGDDPRFKCFRNNDYRYLCIVAVQVLFFMTFPSSTFYSISMLRCVLIDDGSTLSKQYLRLDMAIDCGSPTYRTFYWLALSSTVWLLVCIPGGFALIYLLHYKTRKAYATERKQIFTFLLQGVKPQTWFWPAVDFLRKGLITSIVVMFERPVDTQFVMWLFVVYIPLLSFFQPYITPRNTTLDQWCASIDLVVINLALLFEFFGTEGVAHDALSALMMVLMLATGAWCIWLSAWRLRLAGEKLFREVVLHDIVVRDEDVSEVDRGQSEASGNAADEQDVPTPQASPPRANNVHFVLPVVTEIAIASPIPKRKEPSPLDSDHAATFDVLFPTSTLEPTEDIVARTASPQPAPAQTYEPFDDILETVETGVSSTKCDLSHKTKAAEEDEFDDILKDEVLAFEPKSTAVGKVSKDGKTYLPGFNVERQKMIEKMTPMQRLAYLASPGLDIPEQCGARRVPVAPDFTTTREERTEAVSISAPPDFTLTDYD